MMMNRVRDERGVALVVAMLVMFVVLLLSTVVVAQAIHNSTQSGYDRNRLESVSAAEAGLNWYFNYLSRTAILDLVADPQSVTLGAGPTTATATVTPTFYADEQGTVAFTPPATANNFPRSALLRAVGQTGGGASRTMETFVVLHPIYVGLTGAVVTNSSTTLNNNVTINGYNGNDGDVYVLDGNFSAPSGLETIKGDIYVTNGYAYLGTSVHVYGTVWAGGADPNGYVTLDHPRVLVDGDLKSTNGSVAVTSGSAGGTGYYCTTVSGGSNIAGGTQQTCTLGAPPTQPFPQIQYSQEAWQTEGYTNFQTFTGANACTDARNYIESTFDNSATAGNTVVRITSTTCSFGVSNNATIDMRSNLAIVTDAGINLSQRSVWAGVGGTRDLFFMSAYPASGSPSCPTQDITVGQNNDFTNARLSVYSPCTVTMNNNNTATQGQIVGQNMTIGNNFTLSYYPIKIPGADIGGFKQDIAYIREVRSA
ncbi:MAG: hypothetical protein HYU54_00135 [Actinobacteria bacterium]|nr:hypothetical protein [Actinomycetota bacterium]